MNLKSSIFYDLKFTKNLLLRFKFHFSELQFRLFFDFYLHQRKHFKTWCELLKFRWNSREGPERWPILARSPERSSEIRSSSFSENRNSKSPTSRTDGSWRDPNGLPDLTFQSGSDLRWLEIRPTTITSLIKS
jgi:hypothetical protein